MYSFNPFLPTVPTFAVRETDVSRHNGGTSSTPLKPLRDDSTLRALSSLRGLRGAPEAPLCRETSVSRTANVGTVGMNGLSFPSLDRGDMVHRGADLLFVSLERHKRNMGESIIFDT